MNMGIEQLNNKIPYVISVDFLIFGILVILVNLDVHFYLDSSDPCKGDVLCSIKIYRPDINQIMGFLSIVILGFLLVLQTIIHGMLLIKKKNS